MLRSLAGKKGREANGLFVAEGANLVKDMPDKTSALYVRSGDIQRHNSIISIWKGEVNIVADNVFEGIADTVNSNGILAAVPIPQPKPLSGGIVLVLDGISDAGNAGTIIRTAAALGVQDIIGVESADFFNPKTVRASMGGVFVSNLIDAGRDEACRMLDGYTVAVLDMAGKNVYDYKPPPKLALVVGNEAHGVSEFFRSLACEVLAVPMYGDRIESLNAAVSAAIALSAIKNNIRLGDR